MYFIIVVLQYSNFDLKTVFTPVKPDVLEDLLLKSGYDAQKTQYLVKGFHEGFSIGYEGPRNVKQKSPNLPLTIGSEIDLWNKVMKEVKEKRFAGPYSEIPFDTYIQSPIGLVPKDNGTKTRLIFHLSYPRTGRNIKLSVNANTPPEICKVKYSDFDQAIARCLEEGKSCMMGQSDFSSAFRHLGILPEHWRYLVMKARNPEDNKIYYFVDKCLPFGASISCAHFQAVSDAIAHIVQWRVNRGKKIVNYLDDFLFLALLKWLCNYQIKIFLEVCKAINFPVNMDKTHWGTTKLVFLGLLINSEAQMVFLPMEKIIKGRDIISQVLNRKSRKITIKQLQQICGFLNFLGRAIIPGRAFTRRLYSYTSMKGDKLKPHHHVKITQEMKLDFEMWNIFIHHQSVFARPFADFSKTSFTSVLVDMYSDAAKSEILGMGATCGISWCYQQWDASFIKQRNPSIEYLELYAVLVGVVLWIERFKNTRITLFCDNRSVVDMINSSSSTCKNCMVLIRLLVLKGLTKNVRISAKHVLGCDNYFSDALSRMDIKRFLRLQALHGKTFEKTPTPIPQKLWPMESIWLK